MRDHDGELSFSPRLPEVLTRLAFRLTFRGRRLLVEVEPHQATYSLEEGAPLEVTHHGEQVTVTAKRLARPIPPPPQRDPPSQPPRRSPARRRPVQAARVA